jgi:catechol 2,3-dioxygenase-like lactoylglutathione lyase family enzyme
MQVRLMVAASFVALTLTVAAQLPDKPPARPKITGISHLAIYSSDPAATEHFYVDIIGAVKRADPENPKGVCYALSNMQFVEVLPLPPDAGINRMDHTAWNTDDVEAMRRYLGSKAWKVPGQVERGVDGSHWFSTKDPEGNKIEFVQVPAVLRPLAAPNAIGHHIIHVGFVVHNRATEDMFYRDLLGFKPYWFGGMTDDKIEWVSQQAPDTHDWLEYMVRSEPSGSGNAEAMTQRVLGVLDHLSIGEDSVPQAFKVLTDGNRLGSNHDAAPKIGKDGKYQFNMYDPDGIRVEIMNFHATEKPCCSPFTADDPAE